MTATYRIPNPARDIIVAAHSGIVGQRNRDPVRLQAARQIRLQVAPRIIRAFVTIFAKECFAKAKRERGRSDAESRSIS